MAGNLERTYYRVRPRVARGKIRNLSVFAPESPNRLIGSLLFVPARFLILDLTYVTGLARAPLARAQSAL